MILDPGSYDLWLDSTMQDVATISELLKPYDARLMRFYPVSTRINHVVNDDDECSGPVEVALTQNRLFPSRRQPFEFLALGPYDRNNISIVCRRD